MNYTHMPGYLAITSPDWIQTLRDNKSQHAVFWCTKKAFKALQPGEYFYFLRRSKFSSNAERYISGRGTFVKFEQMNYDTIWDKYGNSVGCNSKEIFEAQVSEIYKYKVEDLGCIILENVIFYPVEHSLMECAVDFSPYIVSGKKITEDECRQIDLINEER